MRRPIQIGRIYTLLGPEVTTENMNNLSKCVKLGPKKYIKDVSWMKDRGVVNIMKFYRHDRDTNPNRCGENQTC